MHGQRILRGRRIFLVNPAAKTFGHSLITPRWLYVIAGATPTGLVGDPIIIDETITRFDPDMLRPGDIVGLGITTGNCIPGYRVLTQAKERGAIVIVGGIHTTIFPQEPLDRGADAVITGDGDIVWPIAVRDALAGTLKQKYEGGKVPGEYLQPARWDLLNPKNYLLPSVQTVRGCPENCSFCSVWVMDGRTPRQRQANVIIEEVLALYKRGFRFIIFADDNFNPATLGRIAREPSESKRRELERIRSERLAFFDEYDRRVPKDIYAFTQMTTEVLDDPEYLRAMHDKMRIRAALIGVESFNEEGLKKVRKMWNPVGQKMVETIQMIQKQGIYVLSSIICGLETDTPQTIETMREFAKSSGTVMAQFTMLSPHPGTTDFLEMMKDLRLRAEAGTDPLAQAPKHKVQIIYENFWTDPKKPRVLIKHPTMSAEQLLEEIQKSWKSFYSLPEVLRRARRFKWPAKHTALYTLGSLAFYMQYAGYGMSADSVKEKKLGLLPRIFLKLAISFYNRFYRPRERALA